MAKHVKKPYIIQRPGRNEGDNRVAGQWEDTCFGEFADTGKALSFLRKNNKAGEFQVICVTAHVLRTQQQVPKTTEKALPLVAAKSESMATGAPAKPGETPSGKM